MVKGKLLHYSQKFQFRTFYHDVTESHYYQYVCKAFGCTIVESSKLELLIMVRLKQFKKPGRLPTQQWSKVLRGNSRTVDKSSNSELSIMVRLDAVITSIDICI